MSITVRRSARLLSKNTGAPLPPDATIYIHGSAPYFHALNNPVIPKIAIQSLDFGFWWRDKDYGDACIEDWYFSVSAKTNLAGAPPLTFSFWRNYVYITETTIYFGYYAFGTFWIERNGDSKNNGVLCSRLLNSTRRLILAASFEDVVKQFKTHLIPYPERVGDADIYTFPVNLPPNTYPDQHQPPRTTITFV